MKMIKGKYEKILKDFENIKDYNYNINDYYLQYSYPNSFIVELRQIRYNEDYYDLTDEEKKDVSKYDLDFVDYAIIKKFDKDYVKNLSCKDLKKYIDEFKGGLM